ncbi:MAG: nitroreductase family protein [Bacillota bacterium]
MDAIEAIKSRVSVRKFQSNEIPRAIMEDIIDCGRLAPCGYNHQSWIFVVVTDRNLLMRIARISKYGGFIKEAGACVAVFNKKDEETMIEDACAATENIIIAAWAYGIGTCWVNSFLKSHSEGVKRILDCPDNYELITLIALGYPAEATTTPKKQLAEVIRWNSFNGGCQ